MKDAIPGLNTMLAVVAVLLSVSPLLMAKPPPWRIQEFIALAFAVIWLAGAIGLFWRKRWAWWSCVGVLSAVVAVFIWVAISALRAIRAGLSHDPSDGYGYTLITGAALAGFSMFLLLGILSLRRECFNSGPVEPENEKGRE